MHLGSAILDTSEWVGARSLDQLTDFITESEQLPFLFQLV